MRRGGGFDAPAVRAGTGGGGNLPRPRERGRVRGDGDVSVSIPRGGCAESSMSKVRKSLPVAERLLLRFKDAAREAQMSTQRATNEALKGWIASRPAEEQRGAAIRASLRALAARVRNRNSSHAHKQARGGHCWHHEKYPLWSGYFPPFLPRPVRPTQLRNPRGVKASSQLRRSMRRPPRLTILPTK